MFRIAVGHVSQCERPSIAMREVEIGGRNADVKPQPFDYKRIAQRRQESRISAKYFRRGKEMCSFLYRLLRFLTPTPEGISLFPIHPTARHGTSHVGQQSYHSVSTPHAMGAPSSLIKTRQGPERSFDGGFGALAVCGQAPFRRHHVRLRNRRLVLSLVLCLRLQ